MVCSYLLYQCIAYAFTDYITEGFELYLLFNMTDCMNMLPVKLIGVGQRENREDIILRSKFAI